MSIADFVNIIKDVGIAGVTLLILWQYIRTTGSDARRNDNIIQTLVGNNTQALLTIQGKLDTDAGQRLIDRKVWTVISETGKQQVEILTGVRDDLRGVAVLGGKLETLQDMITRMKSSVDLLIAASANDAEDREDIQGTLMRVESQLNILIDESRDSHSEILDAIQKLFPPPNDTEPHSAKPPAPPERTEADGAKTNATVDLPVTTGGDEAERKIA